MPGRSGGYTGGPGWRVLGGTTRLYGNGVLEGYYQWARPKIPCMDHGSNPGRIGCVLSGAKDYRCAAKAVINEVRLYSRTLNEV